ncbi:MAG TPA: LacI family DNA-binding transcriptional regulator [Devosiaceae bacterium]|nr:LacI family DNA-binding transcriptional regulator [Devosiaceae bacterium]
MSSLPANKRSPTITDVAAAAKVSRATVSRAFSQPHLLSAETVARVTAVAAQLGYVPNHTARALSTGRAGNLALMVPDIGNPFFTALMRGVQTRALEADYATFLGDSDENPELEDVLIAKLSAQVDGLIFAAPRLSDEALTAHAHRKPLVLINRDLPNIPRILIDTASTYAVAMEHLISLGHRSIAYVEGPPLAWSNAQRLKAVRSVARKHGIRLIRIPTARPTFECGQASVRELIDSGITGALAYDDLMAQGIMAGLASHGLSVPDDMSVIGCDGVLATRAYPPLTSITVHCAEAGEQAVDLLTDLLQGRAASSTTRLVLPTEFVIRATTAPPPRGHAHGMLPRTEPNDTPAQDFTRGDSATHPRTE